jgi:prophage regulatory protein
MQDDKSTRPLVILRRKQVLARTALPPASIYNKLNPKSPGFDPSFPVQIMLGAKAVGWIESEIDDWVASRPRVRTSKTEG